MSPLILKYVRKRVFNPQFVEDVFQEVLLSFHKALHTYRTDLPLGPWFFAVARNAIWTALGKNRKFAQREILMEEFPAVAAPEKFEDENHESLHQALESLPVIYRKAVEMLKFRGMRVDEAAKELGISKVALRVRAHRGYALLRKSLLKQRRKKK
jgi:RNA polymerase sigma-70 factor (ECF subfamily)